MSLGISSGHVAVKPNHLPVSSSRTKGFSLTASYLPCKKLTPQWSIHKKMRCLWAKTSSKQVLNGVAEFTFLSCLTLFLKEHLTHDDFGIRLPYICQLWTEGPSINARQVGEGYVGLHLPSLIFFILFYLFQIRIPHSPVTGKRKKKSVCSFSQPLKPQVLWMRLLDTAYEVLPH